MKGFLKRYSGQAAFIAVAASLAAAVTLLAAVAAWSFLEIGDQAARWRLYRVLGQEAGKADSLSAAYRDLLQELEGVHKALPAENQGSHVLNLLVEEARRRELGISGINALDGVSFKGYEELPFELDLSGRFLDLVRYLHALETQGMVLRVRRLAIRSEGINKSRVIAKLELSVYMPKGEWKPASAGPEAALHAEGLVP